MAISFFQRMDVLEPPQVFPRSHPSDIDFTKQNKNLKFDM